MEVSKRTTTGVLVIGSGAAGLRAAIAARGLGAEVTLLSESPVGFRNNTAISRAVFATSGVWAEAGDSPEAHAQDIMAGGRMIGDRRLVAAMTRSVRRQVDDLRAFGVSFREWNGALQVGRAPGHSFPRHVSIEANRGINITRPMRRHAESIGVRFMEGIAVARLLKAAGRVVGALGVDGRGKVAFVTAGATVLATGGGGRNYLRTNNALGSGGDGYALACQAGATLRDMEFVQFYPTALGDGTRMCFYEGYLPLGATIRNAAGEDVLAKRGLSDPALATRDVLTRTIMEEIRAGQGVEGKLLFDLSTIPPERSGAGRRLLTRTEGRLLDGRWGPDRLPVAPTVHFFMGGIRINEAGETGVPGLYAAGEVCGGVHGANRLGGNAIAETLVFGAIAGESAAAASAGATTGSGGVDEDVAAGLDGLSGLARGDRAESLDELALALRRSMWEHAGPIRDREGLQGACRDIAALRGRIASASVADPAQLRQAVRLSSMLTVSEMICRAALMRTESRGAHFRSDCPSEDPGWLKTVNINLREGSLVLTTSLVGGDG